MNITILTTYFYPEITATTHLLWDLANDLAEYGAKVTVVTRIPSRGIDQEIKRKYADRKVEKVNSHLRIIRVGSDKTESNSFISRAMRYLVSTVSLYQTAKKISTDVFLISSTPPFLGIAGAFLANKAPAIYNLQDIFPDSLENAGKITEKSILMKVLRKVEQFIYKRQNHIITISKDFQKILLSRGVKENKISVVYNWIDETKVISIPRNENILFDRYGFDSSKFYITYCGNIGYSQNLEMVVDIAKELESEFPDLRFVFIGNGAWKDNLNQYIEDKLINTVTLIPFQQYEDISHVMSLGNVSLVCSKTNIGTSSFPSKTWSIMSASVPVICSFDMNSELCEIITNANCGVCVPAEDKEALKEAIKFVFNHRDELKQLGSNGREYIEKYLNRKAATHQYFDIIKDLSIRTNKINTKK
jgi:glycosyltransferase involved in cell wall biosynthesis